MKQHITKYQRDGFKVQLTVYMAENPDTGESEHCYQIHRKKGRSRSWENIPLGYSALTRRKAAEKWTSKEAVEAAKLALSAKLQKPYKEAIKKRVL